MGEGQPFSLPLGSDDIVLPFRVEALDTRGRSVRLGKVLDDILARHAYPAKVERLLAQAIALTALMGSSLKFDGRFQLQTKSEGPVSMLVVDFSTPADMRAYARFDADAVAKLPENVSAADLLGQGHLGFTIEQTALQSRYQGIVGLEGQGLEAAAMQYFRQSEQIPSVVRLAVAEEQVMIDGGAPPALARRRHSRAVPAAGTGAHARGRSRSRRRAGWHAEARGGGG